MCFLTCIYFAVVPGCIWQSAPGSFQVSTACSSTLYVHSLCLDSTWAPLFQLQSPLSVLLFSYYNLSHYLTHSYNTYISMFHIQLYSSNMIMYKCELPTVTHYCCNTQLYLYNSNYLPHQYQVASLIPISSTSPPGCAISISCNDHKWQSINHTCDYLIPFFLLYQQALYITSTHSVSLIYSSRNISHLRLSGVLPAFLTI